MRAPAIILLLAAPAVLHALPTEVERVREARRTVSSLAIALEMYRLDYNAYPSNTEGLDALVKPDASPKGPYLRSKAVPLDPWGNRYRLITSPCVGVISLGADGKVGGDGANADITSC